MKNNELPKFERAPVQPHQEQNEKEIWQPSWSCYCCHDTGRVQPHLVAKIIPDYNLRTDKLAVCQSCFRGNEWTHLEENLDRRFTPEICKKLDKIERDDWKATIKAQFEAKAAINAATAAFAQSKSLRSKNRTEEENRAVEEKKAQIEAISSEQWREMAYAYFGENPDDALG